MYLDGEYLLSRTKAILFIGTSVEEPGISCLNAQAPAGWSLTFVTSDDIPEGISSDVQWAAIICTPDAAASLDAGKLQWLKSRAPVFLDTLPLSVHTETALPGLLKEGKVTAEDHAGSADETPSRGSSTVMPVVRELAATKADEYEALSILFDSITSTTPDFIYVFNREGRFLYANKRLLTVWGRELEEIKGKTCLELGYEQWHHDMHMREIAQVIETKESIRGEVPFRAPLTGIFGIYEYIFTPVLSADGEVEFISGTTRDVTQRKRAEENLRQNMALLEIALSASKTGTFRWDPVADKFLAMDSSFREMFGIKDENSIIASSEIFELIHPDDIPAVSKAVSEISEGKDLEMEFRIPKPDGSVTWVFDRAKAFRDEQGKLIQVIGACTDITRLKEAELELRASERHREFVLESMPQKIFLTSPAGETLYLNSIWSSYTGLPLGELKYWPNFIHPADLPRNLEVWRQALEKGESFYFEHRFLTADGEYRWHISRAVPMRNENGEIQLWIGSCTDIHDMKMAQQSLEEREDRLAALNLELQQARDTAVAASTAKSKFLASMSHELRTPLNAIIGYSEMIRDELVDSGAHAMVEDVEKIILSGTHLLTVISDILDISKVEAGKMEFHIEPFDIHDVVQEAITLVKPLVDRNQNSLDVIICESRPLHIMSDRVRLRQVLFNLLSNAAKFTQGGKITVSCERKRSSAGLDFIEIIVTDSGIGIPDGKVDEIFQEFSQLERRTHPMFGGTGLGLAISRRLCLLLGGDIEAASKQGVGSVFTVRLPIQFESAARDFPD